MGIVLLDHKRKRKTTNNKQSSTSSNAFLLQRNTPPTTTSTTINLFKGKKADIQVFPAPLDKTHKQSMNPTHEEEFLAPFSPLVQGKQSLPQHHQHQPVVHQNNNKYHLTRQYRNELFLLLHPLLLHYISSSSSSSPSCSPSSLLPLPPLLP